MVVYESLMNVFAEQMFTLQLSNILPRAIVKKKVDGTRLATKIMSSSNLYIHSYSFATGMTNMPPNIFISNVLLTNPSEINAA